MAERLEAVETPLSAAEVAVALARAWRARTGQTPTREALAVLLAQSALETGRWGAVRGASIRCHNLGGIKANPAREDHACYPTREHLPPEVARRWIVGAGPAEDGSGLAVQDTGQRDGTLWVVRVLPPHPACCFRAWHTLAEGAAAYLALLRDRYAKAWPHVEVGSPGAFVLALKSLGYFTGNVDEYRVSVESLWREYLALPWPELLEQLDRDDAERAWALGASTPIENEQPEGRC